MIVLLVYVAALIIVVLKRGMKSILWLIMLFILISTLLNLAAITVRQTFLTQCSHTNQQQNVYWLWDFLANLFLGTAVTFFSFAAWLLAYKYWEVSWTVPLQLKD